MGWITSQLQERLHDPMLELAMSLTTPFATYLLCEWLQVSGRPRHRRRRPVSARAGGIGISALARLNILAFWRAVVFVVNCLVFVLIGIRLPVIARSLLDQQALSWPRVAGLVAVLSLVAIGVRFLWIFTATYGVRVLLPSLQQRDPASARVSTLVSWCGMRGVVSLAAALAIPVALPSGEPFPYRDLVILLAFGIVFVTLVGQGLTLPALIKALRLKTDNRRGDESRARARGDAARRDPGRGQPGRRARDAGARSRRGEAILQQPVRTHRQRALDSTARRACGWARRQRSAKCCSGSGGTRRSATTC